MNKTSAKRSINRAPTHPGAILREDVLPALQLSVAEAARQMHVSRQTLHALLSEKKGFTPEMALRIGKLAGNGPTLWLRMQQEFDLWHESRLLADELKTIRKAAA